MSIRLLYMRADRSIRRFSRKAQIWVSFTCFLFLNTASKERQLICSGAWYRLIQNGKEESRTLRNDYLMRRADFRSHHSHADLPRWLILTVVFRIACLAVFGFFLLLLSVLVICCFLLSFPIFWSAPAHTPLLKGVPRTPYLSSCRAGAVCCCVVVVTSFGGSSS